MKKIFFLSNALIFLLISSTTVFATGGTTPVCKNGKLNLVITDKVTDCLKNTEARYCFFNPYIEIHPAGKEQCNDIQVGLQENTNSSISFSNLPTHVLIQYQIAYRIGSKWTYPPQELQFIYANGRTYDNCDKIIGHGLKCTHSEHPFQGHKVYTLTINNN